jgi:hypothetical protein
MLFHFHILMMKIDGYRLSHLALSTLLEERGFPVLDAGYEHICTQKSPRRRDDPVRPSLVDVYYSKKKEIDELAMQQHCI